MTSNKMKMKQKIALLFATLLILTVLSISAWAADDSTSEKTLEENGLPLYAQHVDAMDNNTLVDIFRTEEHACLLGTDAMRDGVDVPGNALRLVVFERVPWPRPDILHRERRIHLAGGDPRGFDDAIARLRLRQAFGRLIRRQSDHGVFVLLDRRAPSRLLSAFPGGVETHRAGLAETARAITAFLHTEPNTRLPGGHTARLDSAWENGPPQDREP